MKLLTVRERRIGATDAAPVLGVGKWANARDVYERIVNGVTKEMNDAMRRGLEAEPLVRAQYVAATGATLMVLPGKVFVHEQYDWATASPDDVRTTGTLVEYKTASRWAQRTWADGPPADYVLQCQWGCWVLGLEAAHLYVSFGEELEQEATGRREWVTTDVGLWVFEADVALQELFAATGAKFWNEHVLTKAPPAMEPMAKPKRRKPTEGETA